MVVTWIILSLFPSLVRICRGRLRGGVRPVAWRAGDLGVVGVLVSRAGVGWIIFGKVLLHRS